MVNSSPVHPASLVDSTLHSPALLELIEISLGRNLIEHIVDTVAETVDYALGRPSSSTRGRSMSRHSEQTKFTKFVTDVISKAEVKVPALLVTLVYINRAKPHIQIALEQWAHERVFLGALILANKYLNDSTLKNVHWALCTGVFGKRDIGRIEREFLDVLDFELGVSESDLLAHHDALLELSHAPRLPARPAHQHHARRRSSPLGSRWSVDSSEMDVDSESSFESVSLPRTPEPHAPAPAAPFPSAKSAESHVHFAAHDDGHEHHHHHRARASALSILRSFPIPHFHSHHQPHAATPMPHSGPAIAQPYHHLAPPAAHALPVRA
ncbi:PHO85 cyclin-2 [Trametes pubescens]|uniref:PHO85 cyclin-2 n=1 Tax=Trametes pubescens TaxID=154538 RepID=A0A1M2V7H8_TRAPU|nr:PHO85 cyclin-2 [Trametes pubescens]